MTSQRSRDSIAVEAAFDVNDTLLLPSNPRKPYKSGVEKISVHYGQLKLLVSEIYFLSLYANLTNDITVVYAGAAPGIHIVALNFLFPTIQFHLYDPARFTIKANDRIHLYNQLFTDETANQWANWSTTSVGKQLFLISDIRSIDDEDLEAAKKDIQLQKRIEEAVDRDMRLQERWYNIIKPTRALLKTRMPYAYDWSPLTYTYLNGYMFKQAFAPQSSTECRLVPYELADFPIDRYPRDDPLAFPAEIPKVRVYNNKEYEEQMFHLNTEIRQKNIYTRSVDIAGLGVTKDYDSAYFMYVLSLYLRAHPDSKCTLQQLCHDIMTRLSTNGERLAALRANPVKSTTKAAKIRQAKFKPR